MKVTSFIEISGGAQMAGIIRDRAALTPSDEQAVKKFFERIFGVESIVRHLQKHPHAELEEVTIKIVILFTIANQAKIKISLARLMKAFHLNASLRVIRYRTKRFAKSKELDDLLDRRSLVNKARPRLPAHLFIAVIVIHDVLGDVRLVKTGRKFPLRILGVLKGLIKDSDFEAAVRNFDEQPFEKEIKGEVYKTLYRKVRGILEKIDFYRAGLSEKEKDFFQKIKPLITPHIGEKATAFGEIFLQDSTELKFWFLDEATGEVGKVYLSLVMDDCSNKIVGHYIHFSSVNGKTSMLAARGAFFAYCVPAEMRTDGISYQNKESDYSRSLNDLGVIHVIFPSEQPWLKARIERLNRTLKGRIHLLPQTAYRVLNKKGQEVFAVSKKVIPQMIQEAIEECDAMPLSAAGGKTPLQLMKESPARKGVKRYTARELDEKLPLSAKARIEGDLAFTEEYGCFQSDALIGWENINDVVIRIPVNADDLEIPIHAFYESHDIGIVKRFLLEPEKITKGIL